MSQAEPPPLFGPLDQRLRRAGVTLGQLSYAALAVTVASGVICSLVYDPAEPLASTEMLHGGVAYGFMVRAVHNLSAQLFVVTLLGHTVDHVLARSYRHLSTGSWWRLVGVAAMGLGALFSGFLLRGDAEARAAQTIAISVVDVLPILGKDLSRLLLGEAGGPLHGPYAHHLVTFTLVPWLVAVAHARRVWAGVLVTGAVAAVVTAAALVHHPGPGLPPGMGKGVLWGPWYFIGLQEMLRHLPVVWVAFVAAAGSAGALGALVHVSDSPVGWRRVLEQILRWGWLGGLVAYGVLGLLAYLLRGAP